MTDLRQIVARAIHGAPFTPIYHGDDAERCQQRALERADAVLAALRGTPDPTRPASCTDAEWAALMEVERNFWRSETARETERSHALEARIAALSGAVGEDVIEAAMPAVMEAVERCSSQWRSISAREIVAAAAPILALAARDAALEEAAKKADDRAYLHYQRGRDDVCSGRAAEERAEEACRQTAADIRTMKGGPARE
jgi:hypothetical protein